MNELMIAETSGVKFRGKLLSTVSALSLLLCVQVSDANAEDAGADRPTVWIELGGQLQSLEHAEGAFSPPFMSSVTQPNLLSALDVQRPTAYSFKEEGKISIQPSDSDWVFTASIQYGRSNSGRHRHQQTANKTVPANFNFDPPFSAFHLGPKYYYIFSHVKFADGQSSKRETHTILDFQAGKDVGLGMFGGRGSSVLSAGVRIAQFTSKSAVTLHVEPDVHYPSAPLNSQAAWSAFRYYHLEFHDYGLTANAQRSFHGIGPSVSWEGSLPVFGNSERGQLSFDGGINGAVLFGRQKASGRHQTAVHHYTKTSLAPGGQADAGTRHPGRFTGPNDLQTCGGEALVTHFGPASCHTSSGSFDRARSVVVPNLGGFAGFSYQMEEFKVAFGYRVDFFLGAIDGGTDIRKSEDIGFHGPFATVSIGLGG